MPSLEKIKQVSRTLATVALVFLVYHANAQQPGAERLAICAACHGPQGNSQSSMNPSLAGQPRVFIENQLVLIREGLRDIPQMKGLLDDVKDSEIVQLANYFSAQIPTKTAGTIDGARYQRGQELSRKMLCGTCHLPDYAGRQQIPRLAGQQEGFLLYAMKQFRDHSGPGRDTIMSASLYGLKDNELEDLSHFLTNFK